MGELIVRVLLRITTVAAVVAAAVLLPAVAARADVTMNTSLTWPSTAAVGGTNLAGFFTVQNANTAPNQGDTLTITSLRLAPSCGAVIAGATVCPSPDPNVYRLASSGVGANGTACATVTFFDSSPDASGTVTLTPSSTVVLQPPGGPAGSDRCTVNLLVNVLKVPGIDVDSAPGKQTFTNLYVRATSSPSNLGPAVGVQLESTVNQGIPGLSTAASLVPPGNKVTDTATLAAAGDGAIPTGSVTFKLYGPNDSNCSGTPQTSTQPVSNGTATSPQFAVASAGAYRFVASYSGDANYISRSGLCNDAGETVVATVNRAPADFDGDGKTDISVFRPSTGAWLINGQPTVFLGRSGDIAVPCDYSGAGKSQVAVFRPSVGGWYIQGQPPVFFGLSGDIPVPGDYSGSGHCTIAVFRPSVGGWYIQGQPPVFFGLSGDIPVPGNYSGTAATDIAVYRPSVGGWYVMGRPTVFFGLRGDIPVPGNYSGSATTDVAVFRPSVGGWYRNGAATVFLGAAGDVPVPGMYSLAGTSDEAVFRPSRGAWYIGAQPPVLFGSSGDIPLPLPAAIRLSIPYP